MHHDLKIFDKYYEPLCDRIKKFEVRFNDRGYQVGDTITFYEGCYVNGVFEYTGRKVSARITFIDTFGAQPGYVALSLDDVGMLIV